MAISNPSNLSEHFSLYEFLHSDKADAHKIDNFVNYPTLIVGYKTAAKLEIVRNILSKPMTVSSWYRCPEVNRLVGGVKNSDHILGQAVDFICPGFGTSLAICKEIIKNKDLIQFDQLILEHSWVHISFAILSGKPKGQVLSLLSSGGYAPGLTDKNGVAYK